MKSRNYARAAWGKKPEDRVVIQTHHMPDIWDRKTNKTWHHHQRNLAWTPTGVPYRVSKCAWGWSRQAGRENKGEVRRQKEETPLQLLLPQPPQAFHAFTTVFKRPYRQQMKNYLTLGKECLVPMLLFLKPVLKFFKSTFIS